MESGQSMSLLGLLAFSALAYCTAHQGLYRVCYYDNTAQFRSPASRFFPEDIDPQFCSHVIFLRTFLQNGILNISEFNDEDMYQRTLALKNTAPDLKVLLAVETAPGQLSEMTAMLADQSTRAIFINNVIDYLTSRGLDGISLEFEYPGSGDSPPEDKDRFTELVQELREAFDSLTNRLYMAAAVPAKRELIDNGYDAFVLGQNLDFLSVMTMELQNPWEQDVTGHNAPLYSRPANELPNVFPLATEDFSELSADWAMSRWASFGVPRSKLLLGVPLYGLTYKLTSANIGVGAPADGPGRPGPETGTNGYLSYWEVCTSLTSGSPQAWDAVQRVPYMTDFLDGEGRWTSFENQESLRWKVDYMNTRGFGGFAARSLDMDDFRGTCRFQRYWLLKFLSDLTLQIPTTTTSTQATTTSLVTEEPIATTISEQPEGTTVAEEPERTTENVVATTIIDEPEATTIIEEPEATTIAEEPEVSTIVEEPEVSTIVEEPERTTIVEEPEATTIVEEPEVSTIVEEPERTTIVEEPEVSTIVEEPEVSTIVEEPERTTVFEEPEATTIVEEPEVSTIVEEPERTTIVEEPEVSTIVEEPERTTIVEEPEVSTIVEEPEVSTIVEEPEVSTIVEEPERTTIIEEPEVSTIVEEPERTTIVEEPEVSTIVEEPERTTIIEEPEVSTIVEEPERTTIVEEPEVSTIVEEPERTTIIEEPEVSTIVEEPEVSTIVEEPEGTTIVEEPKGSTVAEDPTTEAPDSCEDKPEGFMRCHATIPNLFWTCTNGEAVLRECAPGTVCNAQVGTCTPPEELRKESKSESFLSWMLRTLSVTH